MKHVSDFVTFDFKKWSEGKVFEVIGVYDDKRKDTGEATGLKNILVAIDQDSCPNYKLREGETSFTLKYEKVYFKVRKCEVLPGDRVDFENVVCNVSAKNGFLSVYFNADKAYKKK